MTMESGYGCGYLKRLYLLLYLLYLHCTARDRPRAPDKIIQTLNKRQFSAA